MDTVSNVLLTELGTVSLTNVNKCTVCFVKGHATCNNSSNNVDIFYDSNCRTHPVFVYDRIVTPELRSKMTYAEATIPCFLKLAESRIPNAHRGIFTTKYKIPKGLVFGPYYVHR